MHSDDTWSLMVQSIHIITYQIVLIFSVPTRIYVIMRVGLVEKTHYFLIRPDYYGSSKIVADRVPGE